MDGPKFPANVAARVSEETKCRVDDLSWKYRLNESEVTRRLIEHALSESDEETVFSAEEQERRERELKAD